MAKTDRQIVEMAVSDAEANWKTQKKLIAEGIIDRQMIALAMGKLNESHERACYFGFRDLLEPPQKKKLKVNMLWD